MHGTLHMIIGTTKNIIRSVLMNPISMPLQKLDSNSGLMNQKVLFSTTMREWSASLQKAAFGKKAMMNA